ncbi:hypothetical protein VMCG_05847 [Cytospora schulzeri]|uniref:Peptidase M14 domain-containing protein n=1 Tax=Cytospora schulzeri TaxID=448051 RepID=A0A423WDI9_9PEZI|nr:hypothetical protein VMCG_05847 [Valsa malicola]
MAYSEQVDRNWPMHWEHNKQGDGANWACLEQWRGDSPGDSHEVRALMGLVDEVLGLSYAGLAKTPKIKLFIDWQSRGQHGLDYMAKFSHTTLHRLDWAFAMRVRSSDGKYIVPKKEILHSGDEQYRLVKWLLQPGRLDV